MLKSNKKKRLTGLDGSRMETMRMGSSRSKWLECIFASFFRAHAETESEEEEEEEVGWAVACVTQRCFEEGEISDSDEEKMVSWSIVDEDGDEDGDVGGGGGPIRSKNELQVFFYLFCFFFQF